jgi:two-component system sensor histidine kinase KdpD
MEVTVVRASAQEGNALGRTYTMRDVHDREESRLALQTALARERHAAIALREADAAKDALILGASHDLSSPVAAVAGLADQLVRHPDLPEGEIRKMAEGLATAGSQLRDILTNLLDAERVLGGHVRVRSQPTDLHAIALAAIRAHGLPAACLQPARGLVLAEVDPGLTERIVDNVVGNALRHTPPGTPIRVNLDTHEGEVVLSVADRGPGVGDDAKETIFEPFQRGGPRSAGLGLGLFVVRRFAELQGGHAWVADTDGGGATFRVSFATVGAAG